MKSRLCQWLALAALLLGGLPAQAAISCNVTSAAGLSTAYSPATAGNTVAQGSFAVNCTRTAGETSVTYYVVPNNGMNGSTPNRATLGVNFITYDTYRNSACTAPWTANFTDYIMGTFTFSGPQTQSFWGCIPSGQNGKPAGTYTDTVTLTVVWSLFPYLASTGTTFPVNIVTPTTCSISTSPGTVAFGAYVAYGSTLNASTSFGVTCTNYLPYTLAVSATGGTIAGVAYTLAPSVSSNTGSGVQQLLSINGTMAAGQAGTCATGSCSGTNAHTLTVTY